MFVTITMERRKKGKKSDRKMKSRASEHLWMNYAVGIGERRNEQVKTKREAKGEEEIGAPRGVKNRGGKL